MGYVFCLFAGSSATSNPVKLQIAHKDRYRDYGTSLIEGAALSMLDYHKKLVGNRKDVYAKGVRQLVEEYNQKFEEKERSRAILPLTFVEPSDLLVKNVKFQKGKKRLPTGREAAEWEERATHRKRTRGQIEEKNPQKEKDVAEQTRVLQEIQTHLTTNVVEISDEEERNVETLDITNVSPIPSRISSSSNSDSTSFCDIDHYEQVSIDHIDGPSPGFEPLQTHTQLFNSTQNPITPLAGPPPLFTLSQQPSASQLVVDSGRITRESRGVSQRKSKAQLEMESQKHFETEKRKEKTEKVKTRHSKKEERLNRPRLDDVSQLTTGFSFSSFLP